MSAWTRQKVISGSRSKRLGIFASLFSSNVVANAILFAGVWLISQIVTASEFGLYSLAMAFSLAIFPLLTLRMEQAIPIARGEAAARALAALCVCTSVGLLLQLYLLLLVISWAGVSPSWLAPNTSGILLPTLGLVFSIALERIVQAIALRQGALHALSVLRVVRAATLVALQLALVFAMAANAGSLLGGQIAANLLIAVALAVILGTVPWLTNRSTWRRLRRHGPALIRRYSHFPLVNLPHVVVHALLSATYGLLVGVLFGSAAVGQFYMMHRILFAATDLVAAALNQQGIAEAATREPGRLANVAIYVTLALLAVTVPFAAIVFIAGEHMFVFVLGANWAQAGHLATASVARLVLEPLAAALSFIPNFLNKQRQAFAWSIVQNATGLLLLFAAAQIGLGVEAAIAISATGMSLVMLACVIWLVKITRPSAVEIR
jgi:O-antigen/teichoic acid export membrane protein